MTEQELRFIVRDAIARHAAAGATQKHRPVQTTTTQARMPFNIERQHASHALFAVPAGADVGGPCVIEPAVACNHCGYCKSYGH